MAHRPKWEACATVQVEMITSATEREEMVLVGTGLEPARRELNGATTGD
jgi:hypothetical protein